MPRTQRCPGNTGWAHIILRGINRENLFYDEDDFSRFMETFEHYREECGVEYAAACLMSNHVHLLLWEQTGSFSKVMKKIAVSYAQYYNKKLDRVGPVFQDRYRCEPVNDERYLLTAARYIWQNPQKAGICRAENYAYSKLNRECFVPGYFENETSLMAWLCEENTDSCMEYSAPHYTDAEVTDHLRELTGSQNPQALLSMEKKQRDSILHQLKQDGISVRTLSRLTGLNRNVIQRA